jgi:ELWxxDGT repeat protein
MRFQSITRFSISPGSALAAVLVAMLGLSVAGPVAAGSGPYLVKDINTSGSSFPGGLTDLNGTLMFAAKGGGKGMELWRSDGTAEGTRRVKDIKPGPGGSAPDGLAAIDGLLYFLADDGVHGRELWVSDGTGPGTRLVKDMRAGLDGQPGYPHYTQFNGAVYFFGSEATGGFQVWRTDGTEAGTYRVSNIPGGLGHSGWFIGPVAGKLYFLGPSWILYRTDGTTAGTLPLRNKKGHLIVDPYPITAVGATLYFGRYVNGQGELWSSQGTSATTTKIADVWPDLIGDVDGTAFISGRTTSDLWRSDGTSASTVKVMEQIPGGAAGILFVGAGGLLFFAADYALWTSDGTTDGTQQLNAPDPVFPDGQSAVIGPLLYFAATTGACRDAACLTLWTSDGTPGGTHSVGGAGAPMSGLTAVGNSLYWASNAGGHGNELWRYVP